MINNAMKRWILLLILLIPGCLQQQQESEVTGEITPIEDFFVVDLGIKPDIDIAQWNLEITGLVDTPLFLSYKDILSFPSVTQVTHLQCVMGGFEGTGEWTGVPLRHILEEAHYSASAVSVIFYAADEYSSSIPLDFALNDDTILVYQMNGVTLPRDHGYPLRLVVPGKFGYKWVKWIVKIELVDYIYEGYWESRGYSNIGDIKSDPI
ncbi:MAG: molybdopterin-dependent oxidoreductase [Theionarchaea archaeon]|nr:molybdopterin-dependent oxidoreductase [Theionarchaea archaeon]